MVIAHKASHAAVKSAFHVDIKSVWALPPCLQQDHYRQQDQLRATLRHHTTVINGILRPTCPRCKQCDIDTDMHGALTCSWCDIIFCAECDVQFVRKCNLHDHICMAKCQEAGEVLESTITRNARWASDVIDYCNQSVTLTMVEQLLNRFKLTFTNLGINIKNF